MSSQLAQLFGAHVWPKSLPVRRDFGDMSWCDLALRHGVCRDRVHPRDVCCVDEDRVERLLKIDDGSRITFYAEAPGPQFPFCTTLADGEAAFGRISQIAEWLETTFSR